MPMTKLDEDAEKVKIMTSSLGKVFKIPEDNDQAPHQWVRTGGADYGFNLFDLKGWRWTEFKSLDQAWKLFNELGDPIAKSWADYFDNKSKWE